MEVQKYSVECSEECRLRHLPRRVVNAQADGHADQHHQHQSAGCQGSDCVVDQADPPQRHGPYWQWTRKVAAKTVTVRLSPEEAVLYQEWIDNNRRLRRIVADMDKVSTKARKILLAQAAKAASK
ncbi:MAG: DUF6788 family protein [Candidatus Microthrix parvicella]